MSQTFSPLLGEKDREAAFGRPFFVSKQVSQEGSRFLERLFLSPYNEFTLRAGRPEAGAESRDCG